MLTLYNGFSKKFLIERAGFELTKFKRSFEVQRNLVSARKKTQLVVVVY